MPRPLLTALLCLGLVLAVAAPASAQPGCEEIQVECLLEDFGDGTFEYQFTVFNTNAVPNAVFFWTIDNPNIPSQWDTISWTLPTGWTGSHPGKQLHLMSTDNGDANPYRIYSPGAAGCGSQSYVFKWKFANNGGPVPDCDFGGFDYTFHTQGVDASTCNNVGKSFTCPGVVGTEESSWGQVKHEH